MTARSPSTASVDELPDRGAAREQLERRLSAAFERAASTGVSRNLALAGTTVEIQLGESEDTLTLLLEREPPVLVHASVDQAEVVLNATCAQLQSYLDGADHLPMAILRGDVGWDGPIWKFLRIMPILRRLIADESSLESPSTVPVLQPEAEPGVEG